MNGKFDTLTSQSLFQYENFVSFGMGPSHHCPSITFDPHVCKARTLADVVFGMECEGISYPPRNFIKDFLQAAFTMGLHRAYKVHVHKYEFSLKALPAACAHSKVVCWVDLPR